MTSPLGFKARVGSALFELSGGIHVMLHGPDITHLSAKNYIITHMTVHFLVTF